MANTNVSITPGSGVTIDAFSQAGGDLREAVVIGDANGAQTVVVLADGSISIRKVKAVNSVITSVNFVVGTVTVLAANANRLDAMIYNNSAQIVNLALAAGASATVFTIPLEAYSFYELKTDNCVYTGIITAYTADASGFLLATELTG